MTTLCITFNGDWQDWPATRKRLERNGWQIVAICGRIIQLV